jgi:predicted nucleic acid-binding protein
MLVLDTNVVSELMRLQPDGRVIAWLDGQPAADLHLTAVTVAELRYGVARLPDGSRRRALDAAVAAMIDEDLGGRVLPFDRAAAVDYGAVVVERERAGRPIGQADAQIAAICRVHSAILATRNLRDFDRTGVGVLDPWTAPPRK